MTPEMWVAVSALLTAVIGGFFTLKTTRATAQVEQTKVDAAAYERAKQIYESALQTLEEQLERLRVRLDTVTSQLAQEQDTSTAMRTKVRELTTQVVELERTVSDLRLQLSRASIPVPDPEAGPS